ncbi:hypothetical protein LUZ60_003356 [Juncus effusus]|nr:hypothetical protein LUZ60_003356 [Juncus effusus]
MAQRENKEETELQAVPESVLICVNNCASSTGAAVPPPLTPPSSNPVQSKPRSEADPVTLPDPIKVTPETAATVKVMTSSSSSTTTGGSMGPGRPVNRCFRCRKRVGLTGFRCRCGDMFCGDHRYSDRHGCTFDYKTAGRDLISKENPVVRAAKIVRF